MESKELKRTRRSKILIKSKTVNDILARSDVNYLLADAEKDKALYRGMVIVTVDKDFEVNCSACGLNHLEILGALHAASVRVTSSDWEDFQEQEA